MMPQLSGWLWLLIDAGLVAILGIAMIYGIMKWRHRRRDAATEQMRDNATHRVYRQEETDRRVHHER